VSSPDIPGPKDCLLDPLEKRSVGDDPKSARDAWGVLSVMADAGRMDALALLIGVGHAVELDLDQRRDLASAIGRVSHSISADWLANEFVSTPSNPASQAYLRHVLTELSRMPKDLADSRFERLLNAPGVSARWKDTIHQIVGWPNDY
jgi:hypothetical protein